MFVNIFILQNVFAEKWKCTVSSLLTSTNIQDPCEDISQYKSKMTQHKRKWKDFNGRKFTFKFICTKSCQEAEYLPGEDYM
jgi:hypothetical protein